MLAPNYGLLTVMNTFDVVRRTKDGVKWPVGGGEALTILIRVKH